MNEKTMPMQKYRCIKTVEAFKIESIVVHESGNYMMVSGQGHNVSVRKSYIDKHDPKVGGYYVRYKDGYESWSPAEAFENGYVKITPGTARPLIENDKLHDAINVLRCALENDRECFSGWQANIAVAYQDEWSDVENNPSIDIHEVSNNAAKRFLNNLIALD